jgi:hypothetical protein
MARPRVRPPPRGKPKRLFQAELARAQNYQDSLRALGLMREKHYSLTRAAREVELSRGTVRRHVGRALTRKRGRYLAKPFDRLKRTMNILTPKGPLSIDVTDSRTASTIGRHLATVKRYLDTGNARALNSFRPKVIRAGKVSYRLVTDPAEIDRLAKANAVSFEDLYVTIS